LNLRLHHDRAIAEVMKLHVANAPEVPKFGPVRVRTRDAFRQELSGPPGGSLQV
jgi:hypothetical protein